MRALLLTLLLLNISNAFAQIGLVISDNDGDRIGTYLGSEIDSSTGGGIESPILQFYSNEGLMMRVHSDSGRFLAAYGKRGLFISEDCSGQEYVSINAPVINTLDRLFWYRQVFPEEYGFTGIGQYVFVGPDGFEGEGTGPFLQRVNWSSTIEIVYVLAMSAWDFDSNTCDSNGTASSSYLVPADIVNGADLGLEYFLLSGEIDAARYSTPFSVQVNQPDVVFCSGFESCPVK